MMTVMEHGMNIHDFSGGIAAFFGFMIFFWIFLGAAALIFWVYCLVDILRHEFTGNNKIIWVIVLLGFGPLGMILYWFIGRGQKVEGAVPAAEFEALVCDLCGQPMRIGTASRGENAGKQYYVCCDYPRCKNVKPL